MTESVLELAWTGRHAIVTMPVEIDLINFACVTDQLSAVVGKSPEIVTLDMTVTVFCDSAGVRVIGRAHKLAAAGGSEMRLVIGRSPVARILQITGLDQLMPVYPDVLESLATPRGGPGSKPASLT